MKLRIIAAAALLLALAYSAEAINVNGGINCDTFWPPEVTQLMQAAGKDNVTISKALTSVKSVNYMLCKSCKKKSMQLMNKDLVKAGYGECWCKPGFGYSKWTSKSGRVNQRFGCSKCYKNTPNSNVTAGPYNNDKKTWTNTACTA